MVFRYARNFFSEILSKRRLVWDLALREFTSSYHGSVFGLAWAFIEPTIYILIMWFFFSQAINYKPTGGAPYLPWLMCGTTLWAFFSTGLASSVNLFRSYSYLMKKWGFNLAILPLVTILALLLVHGVFVLLLIVVLIASGVQFSIWWFQSIYYLFALTVLLVGAGWMLASISLFIKDVKNIVAVILQFGFWVSPIFWDINTFPEKYRFLLKINPLYHVIMGYRNSFLFHQPFWADTFNFVYYWTFTLLILTLGFFTYKKLRPHFGDVI